MFKHNMGRKKEMVKDLGDTVKSDDQRLDWEDVFYMSGGGIHEFSDSQFVSKPDFEHSPMPCDMAGGSLPIRSSLVMCTSAVQTANLPAYGYAGLVRSCEQMLFTRSVICSIIVWP
ncbi:hypothetical protein C5167_042253 [Papaver somniferum]|uniref:Uncharacterized protein n=1 Tax=Papaver somniferum TaxID=3469 RepID=A0A4Y7L3Z8_PAPSO|nr:hypothetical protein C5167_042253 [Papaver somniferum]